MIELLLACVLASKVPEAPLAGTVRAAESGAVLAGALVEVTDVAAQVWSDTSGAYSIDPGQPGLHHVRVSRAGYRTRMLDVVTSVDVALHVDVMLEAEPQPLPAISIRARRAMPDPVAGASTVADETDGRNLDARGIRTSAATSALLCVLCAARRTCGSTSSCASRAAGRGRSFSIAKYSASALVRFHRMTPTGKGTTAKGAKRNAKLGLYLKRSCAWPG